MTIPQLKVGYPIKHIVTGRTGIIVAKLWFGRWKVCLLNNEGCAQYYNVYSSEIVRRW